MTNLIEIRNLTKRFGDLLVLDDISVNFKKGESERHLLKNAASIIERILPRIRKFI